MNDLIFIHNLELFTTTGILPHERNFAQKVIINLQLEADNILQAADGDITKTIDYARAVQLVCDIVENGFRPLLETLAQDLINALFVEFSLLKAIEISINKCAAVNKTREIGIKIRRERNS